MSAPPSEARLRAEARKAKIQARGGAGLARLASTARGEEGAKLYETPPPPIRRTTSENQVSSLPPSSSQPSTFSPTPSQSQQEFLSQMFGGFPPAFDGSSPSSPSPDADPLQAMLQSLQSFSSGSGSPFPNPMGDSAGGLFPPGFDPSAGTEGQQDLMYSGVKSRMDRVFTIAHFLGVLGLVVFVLGWWEPTVRERRARTGFVGEWDRGNLAWNDKGAGVELPVFWAFATLSLILQTTRVMLFRSRPPPSKLLSLASPFLPFLPAQLKGYLFTASRYISMVTQFGQDLCLLLFCVALGRWIRSGQDLTGGNELVVE
ncbi:hypothetical protein [Phaffia rhodozyma]|uniref:GET complex, subunit GET2 n=1 Tax=Phaffia rhodozyma TaxID=264483 RepID=A0A0F7SNQ2_PHARH|nr:hypothetical protein [Phaffia rhodozyma]